jgi:hypothetical protein
MAMAWVITLKFDDDVDIDVPMWPAPAHARPKSLQQ